MSEKLKISPPWIIAAKMIGALFAADPAVSVQFDEANRTLNLYVDGVAKANALSRALPTAKSFGGVVLKITVIPANVLGTSTVDIFQAAFEGNPAVSFIRSGDDPLTSGFNYIAFAPDVVQFYADNLGSVGGLKSMLYEDIAKEIFGDFPGIYFCTAPKN